MNHEISFTLQFEIPCTQNTFLACIPRLLHMHTRAIATAHPVGCRGLTTFTKQPLESLIRLPAATHRRVYIAFLMQADPRMAYLYLGAAKSDPSSTPHAFPAQTGLAPPLTAQAPILAPGTTQQPMPITSLTPLQHNYEHSQPQIPPLGHTSINSLNLLGTQTPQAPLAALGPSLYVSDHLLLGPFQPGHNPNAASGILGGLPLNIPSISSVPGLAAPAELATNNNGPGPSLAGLGSGFGQSTIPGLNSFLHGTSFRRTGQEATSDPANFGHYPYVSSVPPVPPPYLQMGPSLSLGIPSYPPDAAPQYAVYNMPMSHMHGPLPGRTALPAMPNAYYAVQPQLQPFRYPIEDRSYAENTRPAEELYLAPAKPKPVALYLDPLLEYQSSGFRTGPIQPAPTLSATTVPLLPSLLKPGASQPELPQATTENNNARLGFLPSPATTNSYAKRGSHDVLDGTVNFKPTETKKNKRPKINKLASDPTETKPNGPRKRKVVADEYSFDETYANFQQILGIDVTRADIRKQSQLVLESPLERYLFDFFVHKIAIFIDTFLVHEFFQVIVSELALYDETRMILDLMLCLSLLILQRMDPSSVDALCPYDYYQKCVYLVGKNVALDRLADPDGKILARCLVSTNLLCIYEMFFVAVDSVYVKGAGGIFATIMSRTDKSVCVLKQLPFHYACFWATVVCDLILSLKLECPSTFSIEKMWRLLDPTYDEYDSYDAFMHEKTSLEDAAEDYLSFVVTNEKTTWWLHKITLLFILVNDFYNQKDVITRDEYLTSKRFHRWIQLKDKIDEFEKRMPIYLKPLVYVPPAAERDFPRIYFKDEKTAVTAINYRLARILLHAALKDNLHAADLVSIAKEKHNFPRNYNENLAREVAGIMQTYDCDMRIWPINIHSLRLAARFIEPLSPCFQTLKNLTARVILVCQTRLNILDLLETKTEASGAVPARSVIEA
mgnify:FL=1